MILKQKVFLFFVYVALCSALYSYKGYACDTQNQENSFGLAMHGSPKYEENAPHLDYANPNAPQSGHLKQAAIGSFDTLNPYSIKGKAAQGLHLVYDRLMQRVWDEPFTLYPLIAKRALVSNDRSCVTFTLNTQAKFSDGSPITSDDVLFSFETLKEHGRPNMRRIYQQAKSVKTKGPHEISFVFGDEYNRETVMIFAMMPILAKHYWENKDFNTTTLEKPITNGPYRIQSVDPGRKITYERNPDYWGKNLFHSKGHYNFNNITYEYFRDNTVALESFKKGTINFRREWDAGIWNSAYKNTDPHITKEELTHGRPDRVRGFIFNTRRAPFDNPSIREALSSLFDFPWVNKNLFYNQFKQITSFYPNTDLAYTNTPQPAKNARENLRKANTLLKDAGWIVENGKRVHYKTKEPLTFEILLDNPHNEKIAHALTRSLEKMGIHVQTRTKDAAAFLDQLRQYDFDVVLYHWTSTLSPGTEQYLYWSCESADIPYRWNYAGICDPHIDRFSQDIADAKTRGDLTRIAKALDKQLMAGHYMIPLYYNPYDFVAYWNSLHRPEQTPLYGLVLETWWMSPDTGSLKENRE